MTTSGEASGPLGGLKPVSTRVMNLAHFLTRNGKRFADRPGLIWGQRQWSWGRIDAAVHALCAALSARGIGKGDRILVHSKNCDEMFFSMFAAFRLGAVCASPAGTACGARLRERAAARMRREDSR